jgi:hypothetical protein
MKRDTTTGVAGTVLQIIEAPGKLVVPRRLSRVIAATGEARHLALLCALQEDGWADLGFLGLLIRKLSSRLEEAGTHRPILTEDEYDTIRRLSQNLQNYAHDRTLAPSDRATHLFVAVRAACASIGALIDREIVPDELIVLENGSSIFGSTFEGVTDDGRFRKFWSDKIPPLGSRILLLPTTRAHCAGCVWTESLWRLC